jgi:hypothetical protein
MLAQNIYFAVDSWFDKLTTNGVRGFTTKGGYQAHHEWIDPFALSLSKGAAIAEKGF